MCGRTYFLATTIFFAPAFAAVADPAEHCDVDKSLSLLQTNSRKVSLQDRQLASELRQPYGQADQALQAPDEGGTFSDFFNTRHTGPGIHKWTQYFPAYQRHLAKFIGKEVHIVEIGVQSGGSMDMWKSVFGPGARVYGCDVNPNCKSYEDNQTKIFIGDQESPEFWQSVVQQVPRIDILIDDGGHTTEQQMATLGVMLPHLSPDGVFITEDVLFHNPFWQRLQFESCTSPQGKQYGRLSSFVSSVHIYPYLLVVELDKKAGPEAVATQLGAIPSQLPSQVEVAVATANAFPMGPAMESNLKSIFPALQWDSQEEVLPGGNASQLVESMAPSSWLFVRDGTGDFSLDAPWDAQTDVFMSSIIADFMPMHAGDCCAPTENQMQKDVDSLHIYPHLLIVQRTESENRLIKAPMHGSQWIPY